MGLGHVEESLDRQRDISAIVELVLEWNLGVCQVLVEDFVFILGHLSLIAIPESLQIVNEATIELDWEFVVQRILSNDLLNLRLSAELDGVLVQSQDDPGSSLKVKVVN